MQTTKPERRAEYGDKRVSGKIDRLAAEIQASRGCSMGEARQEALKQMIAKMK
jgi:hypothetical protein